MMAHFIAAFFLIEVVFILNKYSFQFSCTDTATMTNTLLHFQVAPLVTVCTSTYNCTHVNLNVHGIQCAELYFKLQKGGAGT